MKYQKISSLLNYENKYITRVLSCLRKYDSSPVSYPCCIGEEVIELNEEEITEFNGEEISEFNGEQIIEFNKEEIIELNTEKTWHESYHKSLLKIACTFSNI